MTDDDFEKWSKQFKENLFKMTMGQMLFLAVAIAYSPTPFGYHDKQKVVYVITLLVVVVTMLVKAINLIYNKKEKR